MHRRWNGIVRALGISILLLGACRSHQTASSITVRSLDPSNAVEDGVLAFGHRRLRCEALFAEGSSHWVRESCRSAQGLDLELFQPTHPLAGASDRFAVLMVAPEARATWEATVFTSMGGVVAWLGEEIPDAAVLIEGSRYLQERLALHSSQMGWLVVSLAPLQVESVAAAAPSPIDAGFLVCEGNAPSLLRGAGAAGVPILLSASTADAPLLEGYSQAVHEWSPTVITAAPLADDRQALLRRAQLELCFAESAIAGTLPRYQLVERAHTVGGVPFRVRARTATAAMALAAIQQAWNELARGMPLPGAATDTEQDPVVMLQQVARTLQREGVNQALISAGASHALALGPALQFAPWQVPLATGGPPEQPLVVSLRDSGLVALSVTVPASDVQAVAVQSPDLEAATELARRILGGGSASLPAALEELPGASLWIRTFTDRRWCSFPLPPSEGPP